MYPPISQRTGFEVTLKLWRTMYNLYSKAYLLTLIGIVQLYCTLLSYRNFLSRH